MPEAKRHAPMCLTDEEWELSAEELWKLNDELLAAADRFMAAGGNRQFSPESGKAGSLRLRASLVRRLARVKESTAPQRALATELHELFCYNNHTDMSGGCYEEIDYRDSKRPMELAHYIMWSGNTHADWLKKAKALEETSALSYGELIGATQSMIPHFKFPDSLRR